MTYNVFGGMLNLALSVYLFTSLSCFTVAELRGNMWPTTMLKGLQLE